MSNDYTVSISGEGSGSFQKAQKDGMVNPDNLIMVEGSRFYRLMGSGLVELMTASELGPVESVEKAIGSKKWHNLYQKTD